MTEREVWRAIDDAFRDVDGVVEAERLGSVVTSEILNFALSLTAAPPQGSPP